MKLVFHSTLSFSAQKYSMMFLPSKHKFDFFRIKPLLCTPVIYHFSEDIDGIHSSRKLVRHVCKKGRRYVNACNLRAITPSCTEVLTIHALLLYSRPCLTFQDDAVRGENRNHCYSQYHIYCRKDSNQIVAIWTKDHLSCLGFYYNEYAMFRKWIIVSLSFYLNVTIWCGGFKIIIVLKPVTFFFFFS